MGKTRDLFKKIGDTKGIHLSCKDGNDKGQNFIVAYTLNLLDASDVIC